MSLRLRDPSLIQSLVDGRRGWRCMRWSDYREDSVIVLAPEICRFFGKRGFGGSTRNSTRDANAKGLSMDFMYPSRGPAPIGAEREHSIAGDNCVSTDALDSKPCSNRHRMPTRKCIVHLRHVRSPYECRPHVVRCGHERHVHDHRRPCVKSLVHQRRISRAHNSVCEMLDAWEVESKVYGNGNDGFPSSAIKRVSSMP